MKLKMLAPGRLKATIVNGMAHWVGKVLKLTTAEFWRDWFGINNFTGQNVTVNSTLQLGTAWACVRLIAETLSTLPMFLYIEDSEGTRKPATRHTLYGLLHHQPNATQTAVMFWQLVIACLLLWGNAYVEKRRNAGYIIALEPLLPEFISRENNTWWYDDPKRKTRRSIADDDMWHIPAFSMDGDFGISPVSAGANVFGSAMAADRAAADTFRNGMKASGIINVDQFLKKDQRDIVRQHVKEVSEKGGYFVLEKGVGFQQLNMNPQDAELLMTRHFNVEEICRWFRVPPFMVGHSEKSTSWGTGIEQQMIGFITFVLRPWAVRIEQSIKLNLLTALERQKYSAEFVMEGLLRGDSASRAAFYSVMTQNGIYTRDNCRVKENLPPMGGNAAVLTVQSNLVPIDKLGEQATGDAAANALKAWLQIGDNPQQQSLPAAN